MNYTFSLAQETDAPAVLALYHSLIGTPGCTWSLDYPDEKIVFQDIRTGSLYILKDEHSNLIAAAAAGSDDELKDLQWDLHNPCELARIAVGIPLQNQGIGSSLLRLVIASTKERGFDGIRMLVHKYHPQALALYEKNGFSRLDEVHMYGHDFYRYQMIFDM